MNQYINNQDEPSIVDYSIEHAQDIAAATAEMGRNPATPTGAALPQPLVRAIMDGNLCHVLTALSKSDEGVVNDRDGKLGLTPLHIVALLYAKQRRQHHDIEAKKYDWMCRLLLMAGANPLARAYHPYDSTPYYPSEFANGLTPPSLRRRMLRETDANHVGWKPETAALRSVRQTKLATKQRLQRPDTRREARLQAQAA